MSARVVIIGLGVMGRIHYRVLNTLPAMEVAALCDPRRDPALEGRWYERVDDLPGTEDISAAIVAVPTPLHADIALACAQRGFDLFIEKPVAATVEEGERILAAVHQYGVKAAVGYVERFNPVVQALKRELQGKDILSISCTRVGHSPPRVTDVGVLADLAVHDIDLVSFITGRPILKTTIYTSTANAGPIEDNANLSFELAGGTLGAITTNWLTPFKKRRIEVTTADAYYEANLISQELTAFSDYKDNDTYLTRTCRVAKGEPLRNELSAFAHYVGGGSRGELATIEESIRTIRVLRDAHYPSTP